MTNTITTPSQDTSCSFEEVINLANTAMANMLRQVIAFQQTIFTRTENPGVPTQQELTFQGKLINAIDKLRRFQGRNSKAAGITGFIRFVSTKDKTLSKAMLTHYTEYAEKKQNTATQNNFTASTEPHATQPSPFRGNEEVIVESIYSTTPPKNITEVLFNEYKGMIGTNRRCSKSDPFTNNIIGRVNYRWLEYNIFQFTLPAEERRFISNEKVFHQEIDHDTFQEKLQLYRMNLSKEAA